MKPVVVIVGRPNVGKSSLFNIIVGKKKAIVQDEPGVTRDRNYCEVEYSGKHFILVDTGGFFIHSQEPILQEIKKQVELAIGEAEIIISLFDGKEGLNPLDKELVGYLRALKKPVFYVVNKIDHKSHELRITDFYALGVDKIYPISAEHGHGISDFLDDLIKFIPENQYIREEKYDSKVVVLGKPNVGKSSLINRLLGTERAIVSDIPGTTRDAIDSEVRCGDKTYLFIDTAGIRRKSRISLKLEKFSIMEAIRALERVDIAILVVDAYEGITEQEQKIAQLIQEKGRGCIILMNKWDKIEKNDKTEAFYRKMISDTLPFISYAPVIFASALTGINIDKIFTEIDKVMLSMQRRVPTGVLNRIIKELQERNPLPVFKNKRIKIFYGTQQDICPPFFIFFTNYPEAIPNSHIRYIENQLRENYDFTGAPIKIMFRKKR